MPSEDRKALEAEAQVILDWFAEPGQEHRDVFSPEALEYLADAIERTRDEAERDFVRHLGGAFALHPFHREALVVANQALRDRAALRSAVEENDGMDRGGANE